MFSTITSQPHGCYLYLFLARTCRVKKCLYVLEISFFRTDAIPTYGNCNTPCQGQKECFPQQKKHTVALLVLGFICGRISKAMAIQYHIPRHPEACEFINTFGGNVSRTFACHQPLAGPLFLRTGDPVEF